ncbi:Protein of unknown function [Bacillus thuringiensis]|uniref:Uncharacterized protein n=1 Tax=Bacillus thuringiensis TaxID=1428 RepID=A0A1C4DDI6_BACTU|nr:Protein of unknown function [Bacillus thuringiensis]
MEQLDFSALEQPYFC